MVLGMILFSRVTMEPDRLAPEVVLVHWGPPGRETPDGLEEKPW